MMNVMGETFIAILLSLHNQVPEVTPKIIHLNHLKLMIIRSKYPKKFHFILKTKSPLQA